jgi:hypothetical protein
MNPRWRSQWFRIEISSMPRPIVKAKDRSRVPAPPRGCRPPMSGCGRDLDTWPRSWMGFDKVRGACAEDHPQPRGQPVVAGRRDYPRPERRPGAAKGSAGPAAARCRPGRRWPTAVPRLGGRAALLRFDLPQTPPISQSPAALSPPVTYECPGRASNTGGILARRALATRRIRLRPGFGGPP